MTTEQKTALKNILADYVSLDQVTADVIEAIEENLQPEDVFSEEELSTWAKENGYAKTSEPNT